jgi:hypothetical protein
MAKQQAMLRASQYYWVDFKKVLVHPPSSRMLSLGHLCDELTGGQFFLQLLLYHRFNSTKKYRELVVPDLMDL